MFSLNSDTDWKHGTHAARVVDETRQISVARCIDDGIAVHTEQVAASDSDRFVALLT